MPTVLRSGPYRFYFYSNEEGNPPHIRVQRERFFLAKFCLRPVALASSRGVPSHELRIIQRIIDGQKIEILEAWDEHTQR